MFSAAKMISWGSITVMLAVILGAFGAHSLEKDLSIKAMDTFHTGITYHFYHGFALIIVGIIQKLYSQLNLKRVFYLYILGIGFFSFNCYLYAISGVKFFALLVPIGGLAFIGAWAMLFIQLKGVANEK